MKHRILAFLLCLLLAIPAAGTAEPAERANTLLSGILTFKAAQSGAENASDWAAAHLPRTMGAGGEWYAVALSQMGGYDLSACLAAMEDYLSSHTVRSAATRQKLALTCLALGGGDDFVQAALADSIGQQGVMSWVWGLHLLNNGCTAPGYTQEAIVKALLELRKVDGGWAITGNMSDADATAMTLQALAPHADDPGVKAAAEAAVRLLSERQLADGGFSSYGVENAESTAQVIIALCALGIDPFADARFIKNGAALLDALEGFRLADGSFSHEKGGAYSESATAQAFLALTAYQRFQAGRGSLYLLDGGASQAEVKTAPGYKLIAAVIIAAAAAIACIVLLIAGKRHPKNFLAVFIMAAALIAFVLMTDFQSAEEYYAVTTVTKEDAVGQVTLSIRCDTVAGRAAHIPESGVILEETAFPIAEGDTVYTVLTDAARAHGVHMESSGANGLMYIHGIGNIYEFDFGDLSGWVFHVNGESSSVGCDQVILRDGDRVEWHYSCELGRDIQ